ncbi:MAG: TIGR03668 family PPOX class F420-dependent oxidoreductase [Solirubrobacterales bacterium]
MPRSMALLSGGSGPICAVTRSTKLTEAPSWARELLEEARVGRLGLLDEEGGPRVLPVTFAVAEGRIWSAIDRKPKRAAEPARLRFLRRDPRAALTVDRYSDEWDELAWVQVLGRVEILEAGEAAAALEVLRAKYPQYAESPPPGPVLALDPDRCLWWRAADRRG